MGICLIAPGEVSIREPRCRPSDAGEGRLTLDALLLLLPTRQFQRHHRERRERAEEPQRHPGPRKLGANSHEHQRHHDQRVRPGHLQGGPAMTVVFTDASKWTSGGTWLPTATIVRP